MSVRRRGPIPFLALAGLLISSIVLASLLAPAARGAVPHIFESVDAAFIEGDSADKTTILAQSFVATANYKLLFIEAFVYDFGASDVASLRLVQDAGGFPNGGLVAQAQADAGSSYSWTRFDLTPSPTLVAGARYWIEIISLENQPDGYRWAKVVNGTYTAGWSAYFRGSNWIPVTTVDYMFRTWGIQGPSITVGLAVDSNSAGPSDPLQYTIAYDNTGTGPATRVWTNVTLATEVTYLSDTAATNGGVRTASGWRFDDVPVGPHSFTITVRVANTVFEGLPMTSSVSLQYLDGMLLQEPSSASVTTIARVPSLIISSSAMPPFVAPASNLSYGVTLSNAGSRAAGRIWLNDTLPTNVTYVSDTASTLANYAGQWTAGRTTHFNFTNLLPGVYTFTINVTVNVGVLNGTWLENWVFGNYTDSGGRVREPVKASAVARVNGASVRISQTSVVSAVAPRETVRFTVRFDNGGNAVARDVWINDTLSVGLAHVSDTAASNPAFVNGSCAGSTCSWQFRDVAPGPSSLVLSAAVGAGLADGTVLANAAALSYTNADGTPLEPSSSALSVRVSRPVFTLSVLADTFANPGDIPGYFLRFDNTGSGSALGVWLNATVPASLGYAADNASDSGGVRIGTWSWEFQNLTSGPHFLFLAARVAPGLADGTSLTASFVLDYVDNAGNRGPAASVNGTTIITAPVMSPQATASRSAAGRGDTVTYTVVVVNAGSGVASDVWINDTIPGGTTFVRSSLQYQSTSGTVYTWHVANVAPGRMELNVTVRIDGDTPDGTTLRNLVSVGYTDANANYIDSWSGAIDVAVSGSILTPGATLPFVLVALGVAIAVLVGFMAWKVYGIGSRDKPRIDELFLLHRSGELIRHLTRSLRANIDSDALSGMLVAVQDFIKESFQFVHGSLEELKFGSHKLMLAHGKHLILAAVVGGGHTERLAPVLLNGIEALEGHLAPALESWNGMPSALTGVDGFLEGILKGKVVNGKGHAEDRAPRPPPPPR